MATVKTINGARDWAIEINAASDRVATNIRPANKNEWLGYNDRWIAHLKLSRDVASEYVVLLKRLDKLILMAGEIVTDEDRRIISAELQYFVDDKWNDKPAAILQGFITLKRDIEAFVDRLDQPNVKPDIASICDGLFRFADLWANVRYETINFQEHIKSALDSHTNLRFKMELRLVRSICIPLEASLEKYATELEN